MDFTSTTIPGNSVMRALRSPDPQAAVSTKVTSPKRGGLTAIERAKRYLSNFDERDISGFSGVVEAAMEGNGWVAYVLPSGDVKLPKSIHPGHIQRGISSAALLGGKDVAIKVTDNTVYVRTIPKRERVRAKDAISTAIFLKELRAKLER